MASSAHVVLALVLLGLLPAAAEWQLPPFSLDKVVVAARKFAAAAGPSPNPIGANRQRYLSTMARLIESFFPHQNLKGDLLGEIIDPYQRVPVQYGTPCFAHAASVLLQHSYYPSGSDAEAEMVRRTILSLNTSVEALVYGRPTPAGGPYKGCKDAHCNFFILPVVEAIRSLEHAPSMDQALVAHWKRRLADIIPTRSYAGWPHIYNNWGINAAAGEALRRYVIGNTTISDLCYQTDSHLTSGRHLTDAGLYLDGTNCDGKCHPTAYDTYTRYHFVHLVANYFPCETRQDARALMKRAAWVGLLMQSPWGENPLGGRSAQHQWNEAENVAINEIFASLLYNNSNTEAAGMFKRAAALGLQSIERWFRPDGSLWIVKNRVDPRKRHGYAGYSFFTQYNLIVGHMLAVACNAAMDEIEEGHAISEVGGFVVNLGSMNKIIANAGGNYIEIETFPDRGDDVLGLTRIHNRIADPLITGTAGAPNKHNRKVTAGHGSAWAVRQFNGTLEWQSIAQFDYSSKLYDIMNVELTEIEASPDLVVFNVTYTLPTQSAMDRVVETYRLSPTAVNVQVDHIPRPHTHIEEIALRYPILVSDGNRTGSISLDIEGNTITASFPGDSLSGLGTTCNSAHVVPDCWGAVRWATRPEHVPVQNGWAAIVTASVDAAALGKCPFEYTFSASAC